jgi:hypothetical protein
MIVTPAARLAPGVNEPARMMQSSSPVKHPQIRERGSMRRAIYGLWHGAPWPATQLGCRLSKGR